MHISGKILLGLAFIGCVAALFLTSKQLLIRNAWMIKIQKLEAEHAQNEKLVAEKKKALHDTRTELARVMLDWDRHWSDIRADLVDPRVQIALGQNRGVQDKQVLHAFAPNGDGTFTYAGDFKVTTVREDQAALEPNWRSRPGEVTVKGGPGWRIRASIPAHFQSRFNELEVQLAVVDELITSSTNELARQTELTKVAEEHLALRLGELNGVPELEGKPLPPEIIRGLVTVMVEVEESRNGVLIEVDDLRRKLKAANDRFNSVRAANEELVRSLPQPAPAKNAYDVTGR